MNSDSALDSGAAAGDAPAGGDTDVPISLRPEWEDVRIADYLPAADASCRAPVVAIAYDEGDAETLACFRAVVARGETSARALQLTEEVISVNPAHYTAWEWRWRCLGALGRDPVTEATFLRRCTTENPKNYQLWNYRRRVALAVGPSCAQREFEAAAAVLSMDAKNYHSWAHRQALVLAWGLWDSELEFVDSLLEQDARNNSAWNQRYFILSHRATSEHAAQQSSTGGGDSPPSAYDRLAPSELPRVAAAVARAPDNASPWAYLKGLLQLEGGSAALVHDQRIPQLCFQALEQSPSCTAALSQLLDVYQAQARAAAQQQDAATAEQAAQHAQHVLDQLCIADPLRRHYWQHRRADGSAAIV